MSPTSDVEHRTSNIERRTSNVERRTSNVERRTSNVERRTSNADGRGAGDSRACAVGARGRAARVLRVGRKMGNFFGGFPRENAVCGGGCCAGGCGARSAGVKGRGTCDWRMGTNEECEA